MYARLFLVRDSYLFPKRLKDRSGNPQAEKGVCPIFPIFLYSAHKSYPTDPTLARINYSDADNQEFNDYVDDLHGIIEIFGMQYRPSEVLFYVDDEAYRSNLAEYVVEEKNEEDEQELSE